MCVCVLSEKECVYEQVKNCVCVWGWVKEFVYLKESEKEHVCVCVSES